MCISHVYSISVLTWD